MVRTVVRPGTFGHGFGSDMSDVRRQLSLGFPPGNFLTSFKYTVTLAYLFTYLFMLV